MANHDRPLRWLLPVAGICTIGAWIGIVLASVPEWPALLALAAVTLGAVATCVGWSWSRIHSAKHLRQAELRIAEARRQSIDVLESITDAFFTVDHSWRYTYVNHRWEVTFGKTRKEILGQTLWEVFPKIVGTPIEEDYRRAERDQVPITFEVFSPYVHRWLEVRAFPTRDGLSAYLRDVSERKQSEQALQASEELLRLVTDAAPVLIFYADIDERYRFVNQGYARRWGMPREQIIGKRIAEVIGDTAYHLIRRQVRSVLNGHEVEFEGEIPYDRLGRQFVHFAFAPDRGADGKVRGFVAALTDVTRRRQAEEALLETEASFRQIVESVSDYAIYLLDLDGTVATWNAGAQRIQGYSAEEIIGQHFSRFFHADAQASGLPAEQLRQAATEGQAKSEGWRVRNDGSCFWANDLITALRDTTGNLKGFSVITRDSTERKQAEEALLDAKAELEARVRMRTADLEAAVTSLRQSRERFELAVRGSRDGIWDWDVSTNAVYFSPRWKEMLGYREDEIDNHFEEWERLVHPDDLPAAMHVLTDYLEGRRPDYEVEFRMRHRDGFWRWIYSRGEAVRDETGRPCRMAGSHTDITERKRAEQALRDSQRRFRAIFDQTFQFIGVMSPEGKLLEANRSALEFAGIREKDVLGRYFWETPWWSHSPELQERLKQAITDAVAGKFVRFEASHPGADGRLHYVDFSLKAVRDEAGTVIMLIPEGRDITERKLAEQELQRAKEAAEAASRAKSEFVANMSHEVRTPMNGILNMTQLVLDTPLTRNQRQSLEMVYTSAEGLMTVINDVLDFSKIEAGRLDLDPVDFHLHEMLGDTLQTLALRAHEKGLELACRVAPDVPEIVTADPTRLRQVLVNLVGNAIKFTEQGEVVLTVRKGEGEGRQPLADATAPTLSESCLLHFEVSDSGIGIPTEKQRLIFEPFTQADGSTTRRHGGTGLGLTISARLVDLMGGRLLVASEPGRGSTFHFAVPLGLPRRPPSRILPPLITLPAGMPILVVDDNAVNRHILLEMLEAWGLRPTAVSGAETALEELERAASAGEPFPMVLLDAMMPGVDGFSLLEEMRRRPRIAGATVMMLSSADRQGDSERCQRLGLSAYLLKPIKPSELRRALAEAIHGLPMEQSPERPRTTSTIESPKRCLRVLLAEDNPVNQRVVQQLLQLRGHTVTVVGDGAAAIEAVRKATYDVVLMDVQMPGMDGFEATIALRAAEVDMGRRVPVVALTAHAMKGDRERCLAAGMDEYLSKPIQPADLYRVVESLGGRAEPPPFDRRVLGKLANDSALVAELAGLFCCDCPKQMASIRAALDRDDSRALRDAAHGLKGAAMTLGAAEVTNQAARLERCGKTGEMAEARLALPELEAAVEKLVQALRELTEGTGDSTSADPGGCEAPPGPSISHSAATE
jgi:two-component system, sensor histidine kinase and response regulator